MHAAGRTTMTLRMNAGRSIGADKTTPRPRSARGVPLPEDLRRAAERLFGRDLSDVRLHVMPAASRARAQAYTIGPHIYLAPGRGDPDSEQGRQLLGHELAHVIQQREGRVRNCFGYGLAVVRDADLEAEADRMGLALRAMDRDAPPGGRVVMMMEKERKRKKKPFVLKTTDRWLAVAELFGADIIYVAPPGEQPGYQDFFVAELGMALKTLGCPSELRHTPPNVLGFVRDAFFVGLAFVSRSDTEYCYELLDHSVPNDEETRAFRSTFAKFADAKADCGNIVVSPPTETCPYGAVIVGDGRCSKAELDVGNTYAQPTIVIDATPGRVQHADELVAFVGTPTSWKMAVSSIKTGLELLALLEEKYGDALPLGIGRTALESDTSLPFNHRPMTVGCLLMRPSQGTSLKQCIAFTREQNTVGVLPLDLVGGPKGVRDKSWRSMFSERMSICEDNEALLRERLGLDESRVLRLPTIHAYNPLAVNLLPLTGAAVVPRQHTLRVPVPMVTKLLEQYLGVSGLKFDAEFLQASAYVTFWVDVAMSPGQIAACFVPKEQVGALARDIQTYNRLGGTAKPGDVIYIPCPDTLDLFDAYVYQVFKLAGIKVAFIETGYLQRGMGNIHCATNLLPRRAPHHDWIAPLEHLFFDPLAEKPELDGESDEDD
jgi:hypothetical protein